MSRHKTALLIVCAALLTISVGACTKSDQPEPAPPTPTAAAKPPALGPMGYDVLTLGMTKAAVIATGKALLTKPGKGGCGGPGDGYLVGSPNTDGQSMEGKLVFSAETDVLEAIYATPGMKTAQGVALGMTADEFAAIHSDWSGNNTPGGDGSGVARVAGNLDGQYRITVTGGEVVELSLELINHDCGG